MSEKRKGKKNPRESKTTFGAYKSRTDPPMYISVGFFDGREPDEVIVEDGIEYERTDHIPIDLDSIPDHVRYDLAKAGYEFVKRTLSQPGGREMALAAYAEWEKKRETAAMDAQTEGEKE